MQHYDHDFKKFAKQIHSHFNDMSKDELFVLDVNPDDVWNMYLDSFPEGTNDIFRERRYYDGSYDRNTIRKIGNLVTIKNGKYVSIWDNQTDIYPFNIVSEKLSEYVNQFDIKNVFRINEKKLGYVSTIERLADGGIINWDHFYADINNKHYTMDVASVIGNINTTADMVVRSLNTFTEDSLNTVLDLINDNNLYRGQEFKDSVSGFKNLLIEYNNTTQKNIFIWNNAVRSPFARFKNTVIGTLVDDLVSGVSMEHAVRSFETKVAPQNYRRTTSLITPKMVDNALNTIAALDLENALERRLARLEDVSINNVLWANSNAITTMKGGLKSLLLEGVKSKPTKLDDKNIEDITIENFVKTILPKSSKIEVLFETKNIGNLVTLTAPVNDNVNQLFKWNNNFAWSYNGDVTDSIKELVKRAGGNVNAKLRVSLAWYNGDDLDLHSESPYGHVSFSNKRGYLHKSEQTGNILDVDENAFSVKNAINPVENQSWTNPVDGKYKIYVHNFARRSDNNVGFEVEFVCGNFYKNLNYDRVIKNSEKINIATFTIKNGEITEFVCDNSQMTENEQNTNTVWNISTNQFVEVNAVMLSPNYWDTNSIGNKHWFFIVNNCKHDSEVRGIYNEYLRSDLNEHRKVFEVLATKTKCAKSDSQLSGLGFSSTVKDKLTVRVSGDKLYKLYNIIF